MIEADLLSIHGICITQPENGYRYNEDSLFLANFITKMKRGAKVIDLGAGAGVLSLIVAKRFPNTTIHSVEIEPENFNFLEHNITANNLSNQITPILGDFRKLNKEFYNKFDVVITNPPYREIITGRISPNVSNATARHETFGTLNELISTAKKLLKTGGTFYSVFLSERLVDMLYFMRLYTIEPKEILPVYPKKDKNCAFFLIKGIKGAGKAITILPPVFRRQI